MSLSNAIVFIWMLPVVLQIVLPLALLVVCLSSRSLKKLMAISVTTPDPIPSISKRGIKEAF